MARCHEGSGRWKVAIRSKVSVRKNLNHGSTRPTVTLCELPLTGQREVHVIVRGADINLSQYVERGTRVEDDHLADILQREPDLITTWRGRRYWDKTVRACAHTTGYAPGVRINDKRLGREARAHVAVTAILAKR
jgi:hypothetical protein